MKALFITCQPLSSAGSENLWVETACLLARSGSSVSALVPKEWSGAELAAKMSSAGVNVRSINIGPSAVDRIMSRVANRIPNDSFVGRMFHASTLGKTLSERGAEADVVVVTQGGLFDPVIIPSLTDFLLQGDFPFILNARSGRSFLGGVGIEERLLARNLFAKAAGIVVPTMDNVSDIELELCVRPARALAIHSPVKNWDSGLVPWPDQKVVRFACPCRVEAVEKGLDLLVEAAAALAGHKTPFEISIYGSGPDAEYLQRLIALHGLERRIFLRGRYGSLNELWSDQHVLLLPSRSEGMPQSLMEAMVAGRPAVASRVGGVGELLEDGISGFIARDPCVADLIEAMRRCLDSHASLPEMGLIAAKTAKDKLRAKPENEFADFIKAIAQGA